MKRESKKKQKAHYVLVSDEVDYIGFSFGVAFILIGLSILTMIGYGINLTFPDNPGIYVPLSLLILAGIIFLFIIMSSMADSVVYERRKVYTDDDFENIYYEDDDEE